MKKRLILILLIILLLPSVISLLNQGLPITHDGQDHVARIANFYQNIQQGNLIPRWAGNLNWGYGHPILQFLYPLPSYFASFFYFIGFSLVDSTKAVFALGMLLSGLFMYLWLSTFLRKDASIAGSVLYVYAPYRFVDLYVRGAIGENFAFIWLPLVLLFSYRLYKNQQLLNLAMISVSFALLILSHNAISLIFFPFIFFYSAFLGLKLEKKKTFFKFFLISLILGLGLSAFFWIPSVMEGKYTLRNIVRNLDFSNRFVSFRALLWGPWRFGGNGDLTVQLGPLSWVALIFSPYVFLKSFKKSDNAYLIGGLMIYSLMAIFFMTGFSSLFWEKVPFLWDFQFPWRLLSITVFSTAVLAAICVNSLKGKLRKFLIFGGIIIIILISFNYWTPKGYLNKDTSFYTGIYNSTTDTGESSPIWSVRFMEKRWSAPMEVIDGSASIKHISRNQTLHEYKVLVEKKSLFRENTLFFPGWEIKANGKIIPIEFQNPSYRGIMTFNLEKGDYYVIARYRETKVRQFANMVSLLSLILIFSLFLVFLKWQKNYQLR